MERRGPHETGRVKDGRTEPYLGKHQDIFSNKTGEENLEL